jgi:hypothetical protein
MLPLGTRNRTSSIKQEQPERTGLNYKLRCVNCGPVIFTIVSYKTITRCILASPNLLHARSVYHISYQQHLVILQSTMMTNTSGKESQHEGSGAIVPYGQSSQRSSQATATQRSSSGRPSQMQVALSSHQHNDSPRSVYSGRPPQMQLALPGQRHEAQPTASVRSMSERPSQMQVALPGQQHDDPPRSVYSGRPFQMQVALPDQSDLQPTRRTEPHHGNTVRSNDHRPSSRPQAALPSTREAEPSRYGQPSERSQTSRVPGLTRDPYPQGSLPSIHESEPSRYNPTFRPTQSTRSKREPESNPVAATRYADRPEGVKTCIIRPGEPHHCDSWPDYERGQMTCTLCRCSTPNRHGDAYTMLNSPRGYDINGEPINWQEAKKRMLDHHGRNQISHAEEMTAVPYVFDAETARLIFQDDDEIKRSIRNGCDIRVNTQGNNVDWHNDDGHSKPYLTQEGAKTKFSRGGGS